jgi:hypothetical protein
VPQKERAHQRLVARERSDCAALVAHLDIVAFVVVAALAEEAVADHAVRVEHVEHGVGILLKCQMASQVTWGARARSRASRHDAPSTDSR